MTTPGSEQTGSADPEPPALSDLALQLWVLALLIAQFLVTCWWFGWMYST
jgi:hypothetical protein